MKNNSIKLIETLNREVSSEFSLSDKKEAIEALVKQYTTNDIDGLLDSEIVVDCIDGNFNLMLEHTMITLSTIVNAVEQADGEKIALSSLDYELCF